jgi:hypothetical protein
LLLVALLAAFTLFAGSRITAVIGVTLAALLAFLFTPWEAFRPFVSDDPDALDWITAWRTFALGWGIVSAGAIAALVRAFAFPAKPDVSDVSTWS